MKEKKDPPVLLREGRTEKDLLAIVVFEGRRIPLAIDLFEVKIGKVPVVTIFREISREILLQAVKYHCYEKVGHTPQKPFSEVVSDRDLLRIQLAIKGVKPKKTHY